MNNTPWTVFTETRTNPCGIVDADGRLIAHIFGPSREERRETAERIVSLVNRSIEEVKRKLDEAFAPDIRVKARNGVITAVEAITSAGARRLASHMIIGLHYAPALFCQLEGLTVETVGPEEILTSQIEA